MSFIIKMTLLCIKILLQKDISCCILLCNVLTPQHFYGSVKWVLCKDAIKSRCTPEKNTYLFLSEFSVNSLKGVNVPSSIILMWNLHEQTDILFEGNFSAFPLLHPDVEIYWLTRTLLVKSSVEVMLVNSIVMFVAKNNTKLDVTAVL